MEKCLIGDWKMKIQKFVGKCVVCNGDIEVIEFIGTICNKCGIKYGAYPKISYDELHKKFQH